MAGAVKNLHTLKISLSFHALKWFLDCNRGATYEVQLTAESTRVFLTGKKDSGIEIAGGISLHSLLHLGTPCHHSVLLELFSLSEYFCNDSLFLQKT